MSDHRDITAAPSLEPNLNPAGRNVITVIGIDRYTNWRPLGNAVSDATGARSLFQRLGFEEVTTPLLDEQATGEAIEALVTDELMTLSSDDSLVLFYAGHGGTRTQHLGGKEIKTGYLIPVDGANAPNKVATWIELDSWLRRVAKLPPKHILVILDACYSGIALSPVVKWGRDGGTSSPLPLAAVQARRSRLVITSALDDELALDSGPVHGHSLFTGCLIEGLTGGLPGDIMWNDRRVTTGSDIGQYVRRRVQTYPGWHQTPDFGCFDFDDRGEMVIPLLVEETATKTSPAGIEPASNSTITSIPSQIPDEIPAHMRRDIEAVKRAPVEEVPRLVGGAVAIYKSNPAKWDTQNQRETAPTALGHRDRWDSRRILLVLVALSILLFAIVASVKILERSSHATAQRDETSTSRATFGEYPAVKFDVIGQAIKRQAIKLVITCQGSLAIPCPRREDGSADAWAFDCPFSKGVDCCLNADPPGHCVQPMSAQCVFSGHCELQID